MIKGRREECANMWMPRCAAGRRGGGGP
jgi:hypothetical protein